MPVLPHSLSHLNILYFLWKSRRMGEIFGYGILIVIWPRECWDTKYCRLQPWPSPLHSRRPSFWSSKFTHPQRHTFLSHIIIIIILTPPCSIASTVSQLATLPLSLSCILSSTLIQPVLSILFSFGVNLVWIDSSFPSHSFGEGESVSVEMHGEIHTNARERK